MFLALIEPGSYPDFASPVPFGDDGGVIERGVLNEMVGFRPRPGCGSTALTE